MPRPIDGPTLKSLLEAGEPLQLVDARGCPSYNISHIPGAVELIRRVAEKRAPKLLDRERPVVVYSADGKLLHDNTWYSTYRSSPKVVRVGTKSPKKNTGTGTTGTTKTGTTKTNTTKTNTTTTNTTTTGTTTTGNN